MKLTLLLLLTIAIQGLAQRMPVIEHYRDSANTTQFKVTVPRDSLLYGPWVTIGTHSYQDWVQSMWNRTDSAYETFMTFIYMVDSSQVAPLRVQGEDFAAWHQLRLSSVLAPPESGIGGTAVGSWAAYDVDLTTYDSIRFRQSSVNQGRKMEIRINSPTGQLLTTYQGVNTGAWNAFQEVTVPLYGPGVQHLNGPHRLVFVFLEPAVMDYDWFELR